MDPTFPLSDYVCLFLDDPDLDQLLLTTDRAERLSGMYIRLTQFVKVFAKPGKTQLCEMLRRATCTMVKNCAKQVDIIIPVLFLTAGETLNSVVPVPERMTVLLIQVKCPAPPGLPTQRPRCAVLSLPEKGNSACS